MNIRPVGDELLVGESSIGHLKRYSKEGEYLGLIGTARIGGGANMSPWQSMPSAIGTS